MVHETKNFKFVPPYLVTMYCSPGFVFTWDCMESELRTTLSMLLKLKVQFHEQRQQLP